MKLPHYVLKFNRFLKYVFSRVDSTLGYLVAFDLIVLICNQKYYFKLIRFGLLSKLLASLMRNNFAIRPSGAPLHAFSKLYDVPVGFVPPPPSVYCFICGRRRMAVARYRMICLVIIVLSVLPIYAFRSGPVYALKKLRKTKWISKLKTKILQYLVLTLCECTW